MKRHAAVHTRVERLANIEYWYKSYAESIARNYGMVGTSNIEILLRWARLLVRSQRRRKQQ